MQVSYDSPEYDQLLALRFAVLRKPLNQTFTAAQLAPDAQSIHFGLFAQGEAVAVCVLTPMGQGWGKLRQFAVADGKQGTGLGRMILHEAEAYAKAHGIAHIQLNARRIAEGFYAKASYVAEGEAFEEVGIPHIRMAKTL